MEKNTEQQAGSAENASPWSQYSTQELWGKLFKSTSIDEYLDNTVDDRLPVFSDYIKTLCWLIQ